MLAVLAVVIGAAFLWLGLHDRRFLVGALTFTVVTNISSVVENEHEVQGFILPLSLLVLGLSAWDRFVLTPAERALRVPDAPVPPVLLGLGALSLVVLSASIGPFVSTYPVMSSFYVGLLAKDLLIVGALALAVADRAMLRAALVGVAAGGAACASITAVQMLTGRQDLTFGGLGRWTVQGVAGAGETARAAGPFFDDPNSYAQHLAVAFGVALGLAVTARSTTATRRTWAVAAAVMALAMVATNSRTGLLAIGVMTIVAMMFRRPTRVQMAVVVGGLMIAVAGPFGIGTRLATLGQVGSVGSADVDASLTGRTSEALAAVRMFVEHPITGVGYGTYPSEYLDAARLIGLESRFEERSAHSFPLEIAAEQGLVGIVVWTSMAVFVVWTARRLVRRQRDAGVAYSLALVGFATTALFLHDVHPRVMWVLVALAVGAARVALDPVATRIGRPVASRDRPVVAMVIQHYVPALGGAERQLANLAPRYLAHGVRPVVIAREHPDRPAHDEVDGVRVVRIPTFGPKPVRSLLFVVRARMVLRQLDPDVVHAYDTLTPSTIAIGHRRATGTPVVTKLLRSGDKGDLEVLRRKPGGARRVRKLLDSVDLFIAISSDIVAELEHLGVSSDRIAHIPNGVDTDRFVPIAAAALERSKSPHRRVIATGRLAPEKRLLEVARRWHRVTAECPGTEFVIVGDGAQRTELESFGDTKVVGLVDDVAGQLRAADVYVSASDAEGLSNALLEAMACGLPCVVTDVGGVRDVIVDGVHGVIVDADDLDRLVTEVARLVDDPAERKSLGQAARRRIRSEFALDATAKSLVDRYRSLARPDGRPSSAIVASQSARSTSQQASIDDSRDLIGEPRAVEPRETVGVS